VLWDVDGSLRFPVLSMYSLNLTERATFIFAVLAFLEIPFYLYFTGTCIISDVRDASVFDCKYCSVVFFQIKGKTDIIDSNLHILDVSQFIL
jgi:hypothetical protein